MSDRAEEKNIALLEARIDDMCARADRGELCSSCFLSPAEVAVAKERLFRVGFGQRFVEWGGYADAERKKIFVLPEYMEGIKEYGDLCEYGAEEEFSAIEVVSSGFRKLEHRDFLGSVLGLGLERSVIGDIIVFDGEKPKGVMICERAVAGFICESLLKVGSDSVKLREIPLSELKIPEKRFLHITDTVASPRLDGVVGALLSLSRERAKELVLDGAVELDYEGCERPDKVVSANSLITVRGHGKFRINSLSDKTKKGRIRLDADKYV